MPNSFAVRISTLYVGQGQANVIEVYRSSDGGDFSLSPCPDILTPSAPDYRNAHLIFLAVVDFGKMYFGHLKKHIYQDLALNNHEEGSAVIFLGQLAMRRAEVYERATGEKYTGYIDNLYISHLDHDHYSLLGRLREYTENCSPAGGERKLLAGHLVLSGSHRNRAGPASDFDAMMHKMRNWGYAIPTINYCLNSFKHRDANPYRGEGPHDFIIDLGVGWLCGNVLVAQTQLGMNTSGMEDNVFINTGSLVLLVSIVTRTGEPVFSSLFPGDATIHTFKKFCDALPDFQFKDEMKYSAIPHHAGYRDVSDDGGVALTTFLEKYCPNCAAASAKKFSFKHPRKETMQIYFDKLNNAIHIPTLDVFGRDISNNHDCSTYDELVGTIARPITPRGEYDSYYRAEVQQHLYTTYNVFYIEKANPFDHSALDIRHNAVNMNLHLTYNSLWPISLYVQRSQDEDDR